jgi:hypothetical protein
MSRSTFRRVAQARRAERLRPVQLHVFSFDFPEAGGFRRAATVLVRGRMGQVAAIGTAGEQARALGHGTAFCTDIHTVPAPQPTPALDRLCRQHTAFPTFLALLTAAAGYRPSIRLDLLGRDGAVLARAYDRQQAAWGDPRRAFVTGRVPAAGGPA